MNNYILEACVDSVESALEASRGGADRLELCGNLIIGGTTPSIALFRQIRKQCNIKIHILIRPRFGDFCYTEDEFEIICNEVQMFREAGADGIVIGILKEDGTLDLERMKRLMEIAGDMSVTLHRAFDVCRDPFETLENAKALGIHTILTSGQKNTCIEGKDLLKELVSRAGTEIDIMIGSGVNAEVIREMEVCTKARAFHMSGKITKESRMVYRNEEVNMGLPFASEFLIWQTDEKKIREAREVLDALI